MPDQYNKNDFFAEMADVKPIEQDKIIDRNINSIESADYRKKAALSFQSNKNFLTDGDVEPVEPDEILNFKLDGVQPAVFKKLRLGKYEFEYHLDLHRKTVAEARELVYQLLKSSKHHHYRCLLITHGKGSLSKPPAKLKSYINRWLKQFDSVLAFHSALAKHGGAGSVYVLLKKITENDKTNACKYD